MNSGSDVIGKIRNSDSFHDFKSFRKEVIKSDVFKKTEDFALDSADIIFEKFHIEAKQAEEKVKEYTNIVLGFIKGNPFYFAAGVLGVSLACGAYMLHKRG